MSRPFIEVDLAQQRSIIDHPPSQPDHIDDDVKSKDVPSDVEGRQDVNSLENSNSSLARTNVTRV